MDYQKAWFELKATLEQWNKTAHNPVSSMAEGVWTEKVTEDTLKEMEALESKMMKDAGFNI